MSGNEDPREDEEGSVLTPEELDFSDEDNVAEIDEGRYVISPDEGPPNVSATDGDVDTDGDPETEPSPDPDPEVDPAAGSSIEVDAESESADDQEALDEETVHRWLEESLETSDARYGFDVTARFDGRVDSRKLLSNDIVTTFENLAVWYAERAGEDTPVEEALGILLMESNVPVRYPVETLRDLVLALDLEPDDTIADLRDAVADADTVQFPPPKRRR